MDVHARDAVAADVTELARLAEAAIEERRGVRGGDLWIRTDARTAPVERSLGDDIEAADTIVLVGTIDDVPVGYAVMEITSLRDGGRLGTITDLFTTPEARGVAVGEALIEELLARARNEGCVGVDSTALPGDRSTKNFFEAHGLVARALIVHRSLEES